jgi:WD40 repeat protein/DNA-binding SARP family transcriptional activator
MLQIRLLGQFDVRLDGKRIVISSRAGQSLLAYLAMTAGTPHRREKLAGTLWPNSSDENARKNLRQELWRIRKAIPAQNLPEADDYLIADEFTLTFNREADYWLDVAILEKSDPDVQSLTSGLSLYQGELLPGFYDDWVVLERERLQTLFESKMEQLVEKLVESERWTAVQEQCERWLALGFVSESAFRALMLSYNARGDMAKVGAVYQRCVEDLRDHLGVEPSAETHALFDGLLKGAKVPRRIMLAQPSGTVTFLFTDIQGSTRLLDKLGDEYATSLVEHHRILRDAIQKWNGKEMDTQGDAFFVTFTRALDAVQCAVEAQHVLSGYNWLMNEPIRVRMGLHTGEPLIASTGYVGMDVHRAARIGDVGHGGQVLLSQTTRDLVMQDLPPGITIKDLGEHRLKDMKCPTPIYQLVIDGLQADFPPLKMKFTGSEVPTPGDPPYKGLQYFDEADSDLFFGRELLTAKLVRRLGDADAQFLSVVIGASGSGKSSLVRAGLIPALKRGSTLSDGTKPPQGSTDWQVHILTPTANPLEALATELMRHSDSIATTARLINDLTQDPRSLALFLSRARHSVPRHTILVVDQFEELFTLCRDEFEREAFIDNLLNLVSPGQSNTTLIVTLRADFYAHLAHYPELREAVAQQQEYIGPMTAEELRLAIEEPAKRGHWEFEPGLVDLILRDVGDEPGALPLLSHALLETWKRRSGHTLTLKGYADAGGVHGAIAHTAESMYQNLLPEEQTIARDIFLRLTELGEGTEDTRRRTSFDELMSSAENADEVRAVLNILAHARLVTLSENSAEVAHEALIREWPTLREWLTHDREGLRLHRHLTEAAYEWELLGRDSGALYRGAHLSQAREWAALHPNALNMGEREFLAASINQEQHEQQEREDQQRRELAAARELAETQRHSASRLRIRNRVITTVGSIALILALVAGLFGVQSNRNLNVAKAANIQAISNAATAEANFQQAESQRLGAEGVALAQSDDGNPEIAALLGIRGLQTTYSPQADAALQQAVPRLYTQRIFERADGPIVYLAISPDGKTLFTTDMKLRDANSGHVIYNLLPRANKVWALGVAFSPDGRLALSGHFDNTAKLWNVQTGKLVHVFTGHTDRVTSVVFSPDGKSVLTGSFDRTARLWDTTTGQVVRVFSGHIDGIQSVAFSPNGSQILTGCNDGTARLWEVSTGKRLLIFRGRKPEPINTVAFSPDGTQILTGFGDSSVILWDVSTAQELRQLEGHKGGLQSVTFSSDGKWVLTASTDHTARLWDAATGMLSRIFSGHTDVVGAAVFAPDGQSIYTGSWDRTIRKWTLRPDERTFTYAYPNLQGFSFFSADGKSIYSLSFEAKLARLTNAQSGRELARFTGHKDLISSIGISDDRRYVLTNSYDNSARLWDALTGQELQVFKGVGSPFLSPDGKLVFAYDGYKTARAWDTATGEFLQDFDLNYSSLWLAVISPDNKFVLTSEGGSFSFEMWDIQSGKLMHSFDLSSSKSWVESLAVSPNGNYLLASFSGGALDKTVVLWDAFTYEQVRTFDHPDTVIGTFSSNGQFVWTSSADGKVRQWEVGTGQLVRVFTGPHGFASIHLSPDDKFVLIGYEDQTVHLYDVDYHASIRYACTRLLRDLTSDERNVYGIEDSEPTCPAQ